MYLKSGVLLKNGEYRIERMLGAGGFGITYVAEQVSLARSVAVKEFFMRDLCNRDEESSAVSVPSVGSKELVGRFREKFLKEARLIASLDNRNIIRIYDVFEDNGTAYYVMEYLDGGNLRDIVEQQGALGEQAALRYIHQIADALDEVHSNKLLHLDVKPTNIMLNKKGEAVLIDFGISKHYDDRGSQTSSAPVGISEGYAPLEQYEAGALTGFTPATDIYSLGATLFFLVTGQRPPRAIDVVNDGLPALPKGLSAPVCRALEAAMQPRRKDRPQSVGEFLALLENGNVKTENGKEDDDGATLVALDNSSSTPVVEEAEPTIPPVILTKRSAEESQSAEKEKPTDPVIPNGSEKSPQKPSGKKWFIIAAVAIIAVVAVILGINSGGEETPIENPVEDTEIILARQQDNGQQQAAELQRIEAERTAQAKADSIAAENKRLKEELKAKEEADSIAAAEATEQQRIEAERKAQEEAERIAAAEAERSAFRTRSFTVNGVSFKMVAVGGGTFKMGATSEQQNPYDNEKPVHNVTLSSYYIGETEVTQALWEAVMGSNPSHFSGNSNPVEQVSYNDCITFINKLNSLLSGQLPNGRKFRLPTEAEWEYAARGGNSSRGYQYCGSDNLGSVAWYYDNSGSKTHPVKQKQPNELGLYDMSGNVWEWCYDWYGSYSSSSQTNPKGPSSGSYRVLRGGSWNYYAQYCRVANRFNCPPGYRGYYFGLRLVL